MFHANLLWTGDFAAKEKAAMLPNFQTLLRLAPYMCLSHAAPRKPGTGVPDLLPELLTKYLAE